MASRDVVTVWRWAVLGAVGAFAALMELGCGPPCKDAPVEDCISEGNHLREDADPIAVRGTTGNTVDYDLLTSSVNFDEHDATDWVTVKVPGEGTLTVEYNWDSIKCKCSLVITDELGYKLDSVSNKGKRASISVPTKTGGQYFIRFKAEAEGNKSVYSAKFSWERAVPVDTGAPVTAAPVVKDDKPHVVHHATGPKEPKEPKEPVEDESKKAKITKLVPGTDTDPSVVTINRGSSDGIKEGMGGTVLGVPGARFKVKKVFGSSCEAHIKGVSPDKLKAHTTVQFD
ncbi:MAG TPA: hypothetical protein VG389_15290 [Myxococcota bacterium]|jgi:hypothetical protein|nr:hypothetical protein [Myxococcota bacterium]